MTGRGAPWPCWGLIRSKLPPLPFARPGVLTLLVLFGLGPAVWRRGGDACHLGAVGGGRLEARQPVLRRGRGAGCRSASCSPCSCCSITGRERVGRFFGPNHAAVVPGDRGRWGVASAVQHPAVLAAFKPARRPPPARRAWLGRLCGAGGGGALLLGHGGACSPTSAISGVARSSWPGMWWRCPPWALNYLGQGAELLQHPDAADNPFFAIVPHWAALTRPCCWRPWPR